MASTINGTSTGNGGLISTGDDSGILNIQTNETTAITVDASQRVGIGTSSPTQPLQINMTTGDQGIKLQAHNTTAGNRLSFADSSGTEYGLVNYDHGSDFMSFYTNSSERMRIDSSGHVLVRTTTSTNFQDGISLYSASQNSQILVGHGNGASSGNYYAAFYYNTNTIGTITQNGTTAVAYNTSSDYRLKENIAPLTGALNKVSQLKPVSYTWKASPDETGEGFIAHELAEVCPQAVHGTKDEVDADGNPKYQGIDTSFLVATLTAAIQELKAELDELKAKVNA